MPIKINPAYPFMPVKTVAFLALLLNITLSYSGLTEESKYLAQRSSGVSIEWFEPTAEQTEILLTRDSGQTIELSARLTGQLSNALVTAYWDDATSGVSLMRLTHHNVLHREPIPLPQEEGSYTLWLQVQSETGALMARSPRKIILRAEENIPLELVSFTPAEGKDDLEPNSFFTQVFNKPIDLDKLTVTLHETLHGLTYINQDPPGVDGVAARGYQLEEVHREYEPVPGVITLLPGNSSVVVYPERYLAYGADLYLEVSYDGVKYVRAHYKVEPLPTYVMGGVVDDLGQVVSGAEIKLEGLEATLVTSAEGSFTFDSRGAGQTQLSTGRMALTVNADQKLKNLGSYRGWIDIKEGRINTIPMVHLPLLNPSVGMSYVESGRRNVIDGDEVAIDTREAQLLFKDGRNQGTLHVQFVPLNPSRDQAFDPLYTPLWLYYVHPLGITVTGNLAIELYLPPRRDGVDDRPAQDEKVVLLGHDPERTLLVPVGVGIVKGKDRIVSLGATHFKVLDKLTYARVIPDQHKDLDAYVQGKLSLSELTQRLSEYVFVPFTRVEDVRERLGIAP